MNRPTIEYPKGSTVKLPVKASDSDSDSRLIRLPTQTVSNPFGETDKETRKGIGFGSLVRIAEAIEASEERKVRLKTQATGLFVGVYIGLIHLLAILGILSILNS